MLLSIHIYLTINLIENIYLKNDLLSIELCILCHTRHFPATHTGYWTLYGHMGIALLCPQDQNVFDASERGETRFLKDVL
jgi:hypothetical protein